MNRFVYFQSLVASKIGVKSHFLGLDMGSSSTRLVVDGFSVLESPSIALEHQSFGYVHQQYVSKSVMHSHPLIHAQAFIKKGVVTNSDLATPFLKYFFQKIQPQPSFFDQYQGWYVLPSMVTTLEQQIIYKSLPSTHINWYSLPKTALHQLTLQHELGDTGIQAVLDIGAEVTELSLCKKSISVKDVYTWSGVFLESGSSKKALRTKKHEAQHSNLQQWLSEDQMSYTLYWGTKDLELHLQSIIRDVYKVQLSSQGLQVLLSQVGGTVFGKEQKSSGKFAVRAQSLTTGKPVTARISFADLQPAFIAWFEYLTYGLTVLIQRKRNPWVSSVLEKGLVVVGGGASISDLVAQLATFFDVPTTSVPKPREWSIIGLKHLTKYGVKKY